MSERPPKRSRVSDAGHPSKDYKQRGERNQPSGKGYVLYISNLAYDCSWKTLKDIFNAKIGDVNYADVFTGDEMGNGVVEFATKEALDRASREMRGFVIKDRRIFVDTKKPRGAPIPHQPKPQDRYQDDYDQPQPKHNYYGLNKAFLKSLNIPVPIPSKAYIGNLNYQVTKEKLREIFSMAGIIHHVEVYTNQDGTNKGYAVIEFDHPVEVVQAISMFHKQKLFGRPMVVQADKMSEQREFRLPEGLDGIGPGLGPRGTALRNVSHAVEKMIGDNTEHDDVRDDQPFNNPNINNNIDINQVTWRAADMLTSQISNAVSNMTNNLAMGNIPSSLSNMPNNMGNMPCNIGNMTNNMSNMPNNMGNMPNNMGNVPNNIGVGGNDQMAMNMMNQMAMSNMGMNMNQNSSGVGDANSQTMMFLMNLQNQMQQQGLSLNDLPKLMASTAAQNNIVQDRHAEYDAHRHQDYDPQRRQEYEPNRRQECEPPRHQDQEPPRRQDYDFERGDGRRHDRPPSRGRSHTERVPDRKPTDLISIHNLPVGTSKAFLDEKMCSVAEVKMVELTGPTSAVVRFRTTWDAEKAMKRYNGFRLGNNVVEMKYF